MGRKDEETCNKLYESGHNFKDNYDMYFMDCKNPKCKFSHNRKNCIDYFYNYPDKWFDYVWQSVSRNNVPRRFIYLLFSSIHTHDPKLIAEINSHSVRPCYAAVDGLRCTKRDCKLLHHPKAIELYYVYHPNVYLDDLVYTLSKLDERQPANLQMRLEQERAKYYHMLKVFDAYHVRPLSTTKLEGDYEKVITGAVNKITDTKCTELVEAINSYLLTQDEETVKKAIGAICREVVNHISAYTKAMITRAYVRFINEMLRSTVITPYLSIFYDELIGACATQFRQRYELLHGHPPDYEFPDDNLAPKEAANILSFLFMFKEQPALYDQAQIIAMEIITKPQFSENLTLTLYLIKSSEIATTIPKPLLAKLAHTISSLPDSSFKSRFRFALMDLE